MTPKEKAKELINLYYQDLHINGEILSLQLSHTHSSSTLWNFSKVMAKKCAEEIVKVVILIEPDKNGHPDYIDSYQNNINGWYEVIKEIDNA